MSGPRHLRDFALTHRLNGRLLDYLFLSDTSPFLRILGSHWSNNDWITNVLYLARVDEATGLRMSLRTSAVLHRGDLYDDETSPSDKVTRLDQVVPTEGSVCGLCVLSQQSIWLDHNQLSPAQPTLGNQLYRSFGHVDIAAALIPSCEIVIPISVKTGLTSIVVGVLNMEYFPREHSVVNEPLTERMSRKREEITHVLQSVAAAHAPFVKISTHIASCAAASDKFTLNFSAESISQAGGMLDFHRSVLQATGDTHVLSKQ